MINGSVVLKMRGIERVSSVSLDMNGQTIHSIILLPNRTPLHYQVTSPYPALGQLLKVALPVEPQETVSL